MYDIVATTDNKTIINGVYKLPVGSSPTKEQLMSTLPVAYKKATTDKKLNTFEDLCNADLLAFGSKIGQITNKGSAIFAMLPLYDKDSEEYKELEKRLVLIRVAQGDEINYRSPYTVTCIVKLCEPPECGVIRAPSFNYKRYVTYC